MAILDMQKFRLFVHRSDASDVLRSIQKNGYVEFVQSSLKEEGLTKREKEVFEFNYVSSRLDFAVEFLSKYAEPVGTLRGMFEGDRARATGTEIYETANSFYYNDIIDRAQDIDKQITGAKGRIKDLNEERDLLEDWRELNIPLASEWATIKTNTLFLEGTTEALDQLLELAEKEGVKFAGQQVSVGHRTFTYFGTDEAVVEKLIRECELEIVELPKRRGTPEEEIERIGRAIVKEEEAIIEGEKEAVELTKDLRELKIVSDYIYWQKKKHDLMSNALQSENVLIFEGWIAKKNLKIFEEKVRGKTENYAIELIEAAEGERVPVEIENKGVFTPFESVTRLYGLPGQADIDPTAYLAGFFFIFFGLSLTDVGYGAILMITTALVLWFYKVPKEMAVFLKLFFLGGLASFVVGLFFGGYFGIEMEYMPAWLQSLQAFDPIKNPIPVFYLALGLGVVQIISGLILKIVRDAKNGDFVDGVLDQGPWIAMFVTLVLWGASSASLLPGETVYYLYGVYAALLSLVLTQGRKEKNIFMKLFKGVFSLYDSISYLSDILSYSRLLALGLATSALAFAVNLIAAMVKDVPYVGWLFMAIILIIGHLFNLAVNVLGAFIHSARLQFVEFFGKFISESGRTFKPFKRDERYVAIELEKSKS